MRAVRQCTRSACDRAAVATLTYVYADSTAVLGPLSTAAEPHAYDLCDVHAQRLTVPRGWQVVRLASDFVPAPPSEDDLVALADAVREASRATPQAPVPAQRPGSALPAPVTHHLPDPAGDREIARRGHLRVLQGENE
ncbi:DUF3499 domain-containing protein [Georgenia sp. TF02-10]|uniref:DUF3499 domain-containing protein n=1 Tax=Georgenia sp. TF02-10 TaxID=2917725 RepID=UPI001FA75F3E|nr:DUF3499 domain-containing protein [Georgenia sp. TF02-10]UNX55774.1 DUF3499 domain-containing protein [Georgenia sp. TF02-10]